MSSSTMDSAKTVFHRLATAFALAAVVTVLTAGTAAAARAHVVRRGETLYRIALQYSVTIQAIMQANGLTNPNRLIAGQTLIIPDAQSTSSAPTGSVPPTGTSNGPTGWVLLDQVEQVEGENPPTIIQGGETSAGRAVAAEALRYVGTPYLWGGDSGRGVDCSGLIYLIFSGYVRGLPRGNSYELYRVGSPVERADLAPGDLVFFTTYAPGPSHVGIYLRDGQFVHASPSAGRVVVADLDQAYFATRYLGARRLLAP